MKLGITMEGGASRTVFSCGVTDALLEENRLWSVLFIKTEGQKSDYRPEIYGRQALYGSEIFA